MPVAIKPHPLPLKHHKFVKEEIKNLLDAGLIKRSWSPYTTPIIVVPRKSKQGTSLAETKRLVIDYRELNQQILRVQTTQAKSKGILAVIETVKIDHIWSKFKDKILYYPKHQVRIPLYFNTSRLKTKDSIYLSAWVIPMANSSFWGTNSTQCFPKPCV